MKKLEKEKYLGDNQSKFKDRHIRGNAIYSKMFAILKKGHLENKRVGMGLA